MTRININFLSGLINKKNEVIKSQGEEVYEKYGTERTVSEIVRF